MTLVALVLLLFSRSENRIAFGLIGSFLFMLSGLSIVAYGVTSVTSVNFFNGTFQYGIASLKNNFTMGVGVINVLVGITTSVASVIGV